MKAFLQNLQVQYVWLRLNSQTNRFVSGCINHEKHPVFCCIKLASRKHAKCVWMPWKSDLFLEPDPYRSFRYSKCSPSVIYSHHWSFICYEM